ncbi:hypothetical protein KY285_027871 [Solanum tuberosum]|nr:hypothetical protein KY285_027871 [Solanum tuberosum]
MPTTLRVLLIAAERSHEICTVAATAAPLMRPPRLAVPDFQGSDFPAESDSPPVNSDDESEYYISNESHNCTDDEGEGYDSDPEYDNQVDKSEMPFREEAFALSKQLL